MPILKRTYFKQRNIQIAERQFQRYIRVRKKNEASTKAGTYYPGVPPVDINKFQAGSLKGGKYVRITSPTPSGEVRGLKRKRDDPRSSSGRHPSQKVYRPSHARMTVSREILDLVWRTSRVDDDDEDSSDSDGDDYRPAKRQRIAVKSHPKKRASTNDASSLPGKRRQSAQRGMQVAARGCHSCRTNRVLQQMHCNSCEIVYCESCVTNRYDQKFQVDGTWTCPVCLDYCSCDKCMDRRGTRTRFKNMFSAQGFSNASTLMKRTGKSLQTWLRQNGFAAEGGPAPANHSPTLRGLPVRSKEKNDAEAQSADEESEDEEETLNDTRLVLSSPESTPELEEEKIHPIPAPMESYMPNDEHTVEPLFLPDTPAAEHSVLPLGIQGSPIDDKCSGRHTSQDSAELITPGAGSSSRVPVLDPSSPLDVKVAVSEPVLVPDYLQDPVDPFWTEYSSFDMDVENIPNFSQMNESPPPASLDDFAIEDYISAEVRDLW
ncbi:hypothetical protein DACRYDRAFT_24738 [Dacryopinax primogenitus]|uniref:Zinc-finger domain-containing protein n=1 Tax=Dacryopinax primogenitus (strain DJM 731) TaxID=1858805 RepID=M5FRI0_DACPD|nr:uncharacterized protein DACRYDRAFT_24738 [Dacryopinax primogenitus]EJT98288.1 hypothetical protein DACRYDRAFT_24738 [Dacryopinax primogenitus]